MFLKSTLVKAFKFKKQKNTSLKPFNFIENTGSITTAF